MENLPKHAWILCVRHNLLLEELCALRARCLLFQMLSIIVSTPSGSFKADRLYLFFFFRYYQLQTCIISRSQDWAQVGNGANFIYKVDSRVTFPAETDSERR